MTPNHTTPWTLTGTGPATSANTDDVAGSIGNVNAEISFLGGLCSFNVYGSMDASFDEATQSLDVNEVAGNLAPSGVSFGCFGIIANGDPMDLVGTFGVGLGGPIYLS